jgi:hypothetical protein
LEHVEKVIHEPTDLAQFVAHWKMEVKAKIIVLNSMKDHFISHIAEKNPSKDMFATLDELFQNPCVS